MATQRTVLFGVMAMVLGVAVDAKAFGVGADFGYSRILVEDGEDQSGYGGDLYLRPLPLPIIDPELQIGLHRFSPDNASLTVWPIMAGARIELPVVPLFVAGHVGVLGNRFSIDDTSFTPGFSNTNWDFGFNVGAGWHFLELPLIKLGVSALYYVVPRNHDDGSPDFNMFTVGLDAALGF